MIEFINDADLFLQAAETRVLDYQDTLVLVTPSAPYFKVASDGTGAPESITFTATLLNLEGDIAFSISGGTLTNITAKSATLAYADMASGTAVVTATVTRNGQPFSGAYALSKVRDGAPGGPGGDGLTGASTGNAKLYMWSTVVPSTPVGTATFTWGAATNTGYNGADDWAITIPSNPGTPLAKLWVADKPISAPAGTVSTAVTYGSGSTVAAQSQNGANGAQAADATVYQWAATIPAGPSGTATFTWASATFGAAPANWSLAPGEPPSAGMTLFAARVQVIDSAGNATTGFNWSAAAVMAISYAGQAGSSYVTAYCASATASAASAPAQTTGKTSLPAADSGGITGAYSATVPNLTAGQYLYQTDGIYDPATDKVTWSIPYWSSLKVATLSAITANLGAINAGSIDLGDGKIKLNNDGTAELLALTVKKSDGTVLLNSSGLTAAGAAPGTLNSDLQPAIDARLSKTGDVLGGVISVDAVTAPAGFRAGSLTWDNAGNRTGGSGVAMTPKGITAFNTAGAQTFALDAATGTGYMDKAFIQELEVSKITSGTINAEWKITGAGGRIVLDNGSVMKVIGTGFGANGDLIEWFGPKMSIAACTKANATVYLATDGSAYYGGALRAGTLYNAQQTTQTAANAEVPLGPFSSNGNTKSVVVSYSFGHNMQSNASGTTGFSRTGGATSATIILLRSFNGAAAVQVATTTINGFYEIENQPDGPDYLRINMGGSMTYTDTGGAGNYTYTARITARSEDTFTHPGAINVNQYFQSLGIVSTEA